MTIRSRTARLDDASGDLALSLAKLELEAAHGTPNQDEQIDFVRDLSRVAVRKQVRPWGLHALRAGVLGLVGLGAGPTLAALRPETPREAGPVLLALGIAFLLLSAGCLAVYLRRGRLEHRWLTQKEADIRAGRTILDER